MYCTCACSISKRGKIDDNSIKCIFFGYSTETKGYCLYDPITKKKLLISRDVVFDEKNAWNWKSLQSSKILEDGDSLTFLQDKRMIMEVLVPLHQHQVNHRSQAHLYRARLHRNHL